MKAKKLVLIAALTTVLALSFAMTAKASYNYELTSDSGSNVLIDTPVTVTATTNDPHAYKVVFNWLSPSLQLSTNEVIVSGESASSTKTLNQEGTWLVEATFYDQFNVFCFKITIPVAFQCIRIIVHAVPEIPLVGTAGASIAMIAGLCYVAKRRSKRNP
jgi:hypothetical protein